MQIIPAILEKEFSNVEKKLDKVNGLFPWVQIDVIDGVFSFGKTFDLELITKLTEKINNPLFDIHLMVKEPIKWVEKCLFVGATRVIGQVEMMNNKEDFVNKVLETGMEAGLAFDIETKIEKIPEETNVVLLLGRKAGFESFELNEMIWKRIEEVKKIREKNNLEFKIAIDGGVNLENMEKFKNSGVDILYCTSAIFNGDFNENLGKINEKNN
jgi:ribulose-phosphate 3-epimerase